MSITEPSKIVPVYDFKNLTGGHFEIHTDGESDLPYLISFVPFLARRVAEDRKLFEYLKKTTKGLTVSHAIHDLYDIGFPVDAWIVDYYKVTGGTNDDMFNVLMQFYQYIKTFGEPTGSMNL